MGQQRARARAVATRIERVVRYITAYQTELRRLLESAPRPTAVPANPVAVVGRAKIWPCSDAALVLIFGTADRATSVIVREPVGRTVEGFLEVSPQNIMLEADGRPARQRPRVVINGRFEEGALTVAAPILGRRSGSVVRPEYDKMIIVGWRGDLPDARDEALSAFRADFAARNIVAEQLASASVEPPLVDDGIARLLHEFAELLWTLTSPGKPWPRSP